MDERTGVWITSTGAARRNGWGRQAVIDAMLSVLRRIRAGRLLRTFATPDLELSVCGDLRLHHGEAPLWDHRRALLHWVDIHTGVIATYDPATRRAKVFARLPDAAMLALAGEGGVIAGGGRRLAELDAEGRERAAMDLTHIAESARINDGAVDPDGALWFGVMDRDGRAANGALHRFARDGSVIAVVSAMRIPNGPAYSPDGRWVYFADSARRTIYRLERIELSGAPTPPHALIAFDERDGHPDGMTVDSEGGLWVAHHGGGCVSRWSPDGSRLRTVHLPVRFPTAIVLGGPALTTAFVTSRTPPDEPARRTSALDGALLCFDAGVPGMAATVRRD